MSRTIISGGHWDNPNTPWTEDPGASFGEYKEFQICQNIRNEVLKLLPEAIPVPSNLTLRQKIDFINGFCKPDDLVIEIHLNFSTNPEIEGTESFYSDVKYLADIFSRQVSKSLQTRNLGAKHDSTAYVGSLGWLRQINAQNVLVEVCYLSSPRDRMKIIMPSGQQKAAQGIVNAIKEHRMNLTLLGHLKELVKSLIALLKEYGKY